jgi:exopolysaccharide biosynthesis polyprenyl glycosylphosphotransferase
MATTLSPKNAPKNSPKNSSGKAGKAPQTLQRDVRSSVLSRVHRGSYLRAFRVLTLLGLDLVAFSLAWIAAEMLGTPWHSLWRFQENPIVMLLILPVVIGVLFVGEFYKPGKLRRNYLGLVKAITLSAVLLLVFSYLYRPNQFVSRSQFIMYWAFAILFVLAERLLIDRVIAKLRRRGAIRYPTYLITSNAEVDHLTELIDQDNRYAIVGVSNPDALNEANRMATFARIRRLGIAEVFISGESIKDRLFLCWQFQTAGICVHIVSAGLDDLFNGSKFWSISEDFPTIVFSPPSLTGSDFWIKRVFDFCASVVLLVLLLPVYAAIMIAIKLGSVGPVFYRQTRVGLHGECFKAWKFRTMVTNADALQTQLESQNEMKDGILFKLKVDPRVTRVGQILRKYSLDELPQLFNVLMGEMSLVGPRPLPVRDVDKFSAHHYVRHQVLPGITGLWQVSGRSDIIDFENVIQLDLSYIQNWSLGLDLKILLKTVGVVFNKKGAY